MKTIYEPFNITNLEYISFVFITLLLLWVLIKLTKIYFNNKFIFVIMSLFFLSTTYGFMTKYQDQEKIENVLANQSFYVENGLVENYQKHMHHKTSFQINNQNFLSDNLLPVEDGINISVWYFIENERKIIFKIDCNQSK